MTKKAQFDRLVFRNRPVSPFGHLIGGERPKGIGKNQSPPPENNLDEARLHFSGSSVYLNRQSHEGQRHLSRAEQAPFPAKLGLRFGENMVAKTDPYWAKILSCEDEAFRFAAQQFYWRLEGRSSKTLRDYGYRLWDFSKFLKASGTPFGKVDKGVIQAFFAHLRQRPSSNPNRTSLAPTTVAGHWRVLRAFFNYLVADELWTQPNPVRPLDAPSCRRPEQKRVLQPEDIALLLSIPNRKTWVGKRQILLVSLLWETAARIGEILGIRVKDVDLQRGLIRVDGKTGQRTIPIESEIKSKIDRYVRDRNLLPHDFLLGTTSGRALPQRNTRRILDGLFKLAKRKHLGRWPEGYKIHPHLFRHSRITQLAGSGTNPIALRAFVGHADSRTTDRYIHMNAISPDFIRGEISKAQNLNGIGGGQ